MYTMQGVQAVTSAGSVANVMTGQIYERAPVDGWATFLAAGDAAGAARVAIFCGGRAVMQESPISRVNTTPIPPDQIIATAAVRRGDQITMSARDTGTVGLNIFWKTIIKPR